MDDSSLHGLEISIPMEMDARLFSVVLIAVEIRSIALINRQTHSWQAIHMQLKLLPIRIVISYWRGAMISNFRAFAYAPITRMVRLCKAATEPLILLAELIRISILVLEWLMMEVS